MTRGPVLLRAGGTSLLLDARGGPDGTDLPVVAHWGADLGDLDVAALDQLLDARSTATASGTLDVPARTALLPQHSTGYAGRAGLVGSRGSRDASTRFTTQLVDLLTGPDAVQRVAVEAHDDAAALALHTDLELHPSGVVRLRHVLRNEGTEPYALLALPTVLPVPPRAVELLDLTGRHLRERSPQRLPFGYGAWSREQRRGRTGHDAPVLLVAGTPAFGFRSGEVWGVHVAWSGDAATYAEKLPEGWACLGGAELLSPGEVVLEAGEEYASPWLVAAHSAEGLDGATAALHAYVRARPAHPRTPRPVVLNTWEAAYFDHQLGRLTALADAAAEAGVERYVLDDGWFGGRRHDRAGLGDWVVSADVWPEGLHALVDHVRARGMTFGLWVEPEMVNPDSDLARAHPEWMLGVPDRLPPAARYQQVLDLTDPDAFTYLRERLDALLDEYPISYLKWDHNRDLVDAVSQGRPAVHWQTLAAYRLIDTLRAQHPDVEIEDCAGGGGRVDLAMLERTDRVWTSDSNDPLERQLVQRWTQLLLPPELLGAHVGPHRAHTTGREADLSFRAGTALFGSFGIEADLTQLSSAERVELAAWVSLYRTLRPLLHTGVVVRADEAGVGDGTWTHGVVAPDGSDAVFAYVRLATSVAATPAPVRLPGLAPDRTYEVAPLPPGDRPLCVQGAPPPWLTAGRPVALPGRVLADTGLAPPILGPAQLLLLRATAR